MLFSYFFFRVIVKSSLGFYYADEDTNDRDLLSKVICSGGKTIYSIDY